jgi:glycosyltransferase involved in cell wall biosynthesis
MVRRKDVRNIVMAVARLVACEQEDPNLPPVRLLIVGGESREPDRDITPEIGALQDLGAELGIADRLIFAGSRPPEELFRYYGAGNVSVSTPWYEPFGLTPLEAMACGRPVIGSAVGGIAFTVQDGVTGFHVPPRDPRALAGLLEHLRADPALGRRMGVAARARVEMEFTWELVGLRTSTLYQKMLNERRSEPLVRPRANVPSSSGLYSGGTLGSD